MANARISLIQIENRTLQSVSILDYSSASSLEEDYVSTESEDMSTSPNTSCRSSENADRSIDPEEDFRKELIKFDDIIEKIENLRFAHDDGYDNKDDDNNGDDEDVGETRRVIGEKVDNAAWVNNRDTPWTNRRTDNEDVNNNAAVNENEDCQPFNISDDEPCDKEHYTREEKLRENSTGDDEKAVDVDLIERGPIKPDFQPLRGHPYSMVSWLSRATDNDTTHAVDYDKTAEQILRNKDYSEKLNPCLDQLSCSSRDHLSLDCLPIDSGWTGENVDNNVYCGDDPRSYTAILPSIVIDPGEESLMDILLRGGFQAAVFSDVGSHSIPSPSAKTWSDSPASSHNYVPSRSNSRASSRAQSPGSGANLESPQMHVNVIGSPLGSPQIDSTYRVPQALSSSSSSNQSYGDASSPFNYQTALNYQLEEQLGDCFESLTGWKSASYDSSSTIVNSSDTIDYTLQLVEQFIKEDKQQKASKEQQAASSAPCFSSTYNDQCVPVCTLESNLSPVSRRYLSSETRSARSESCMNMPSASSMIDSLIDGCLVSVYTNKESTGGCTLMSRTIDSHAMSPMEQRYYEPGLKNGTRGAPIDSVSRHGAALYDIGLNGERSARASQQNVSQGRHTLLCNVDGEKRPYEQPSSFVSDNYQLPTMVSSFASNCPQRKSDRGIVPWPSLNLPSVRASERLKEGLHPKEVERAMSNLLKKSVEELAATDEDGDTALMCLVSNPEELTRKKAYLAPLVERLGNMSGALSMVNNRGEDALYLAAINCPEMPYVTGYLAAAMLQKGIDIGQSLYHGDTLIHSIAARGDSHGEILADLLVLKTQQGNPVFDLSKCNHDGKTALHVAVESHDAARRGVKSLATTRLLLENGANLRIKNPKCGNTALHVAVSLSCDPALVKVLLRKVTSDVVNETNYMYNTPLHIVAAISSTVSLEKQQEVCQLLIQAGGQTNMQNRQGKTPLALVSPDRKEAIRKIFYKKS